MSTQSYTIQLRRLERSHKRASKAINDMIKGASTVKRALIKWQNAEAQSIAFYRNADKLNKLAQLKH